MKIALFAIIMTISASTVKADSSKRHKTTSQLLLDTVECKVDKEHMELVIKTGSDLGGGIYLASSKVETHIISHVCKIAKMISNEKIYVSLKYENSKQMNDLQLKEHKILTEGATGGYIVDFVGLEISAFSD